MPSISVSIRRSPGYPDRIVGEVVYHFVAPGGMHDRTLAQAALERPAKGSPEELAAEVMALLVAALTPQTDAL